jgi:hypothetical protein
MAMTKGKPISPDEVVERKNNLIPDEVIDIFNDLIVLNFRGTSATIRQKDVLKLIAERLNISNQQVVFDNKWLDVEDIFRQQGWKVSYDKPGYNESYNATFTFSKK